MQLLTGPDHGPGTSHGPKLGISQAGKIIGHETWALKWFVTIHVLTFGMFTLIASQIYY